METTVNGASMLSNSRVTSDGTPSLPPRPKQIPTPTVEVWVGGTYDRDSARIIGGKLSATEPLPTEEGGTVVIGRDRTCTVLVPGASCALSRRAVEIVRHDRRLGLWVQTASGGMIHLPDGQMIDIAVSSKETPKPDAQFLDLRHGTVVELVIAAYLHAFLVFDIPRVAVAPPPSLAGDAGAPESVVAGRPDYVLTDADKEMLVAVCPDRVATAPFGLQMPSTPGLAATVLRQCAVRYFDGKGERSTYDSDKLNQTLAAFIRRIDVVEEAACVDDARRLSTRVEHYKDGGHSGTLGVDEWLGERPELVALLDFDLAVAMRDARDHEIVRMRTRRVESGQRGAAESARRQLRRKARREAGAANADPGARKARA